MTETEPEIITLCLHETSRIRRVDPGEAGNRRTYDGWRWVIEHGDYIVLDAAGRRHGFHKHQSRQGSGDWHLTIGALDRREEEPTYGPCGSEHTGRDCVYCR